MDPLTLLIIIPISLATMGIGFSLGGLFEMKLNSTLKKETSNFEAQKGFGPSSALQDGVINKFSGDEVMNNISGCFKQTPSAHPLSFPNSGLGPFDFETALGKSALTGYSYPKEKS